MDQNHQANAAESLLAHEQNVSPDVVLPLIMEEVDIRKEQVTKATFRLTKAVHERPELINEFLTSEHFVVERLPRDELVDTPPTVRFEGDVIVIPVIEEILVVKKELRLKEELRITKKQIVHEHRQEVTLRSEELIVERFSENSAGK